MRPDHVEDLLAKLAAGSRFECFEHGGGVCLAPGIDRDGAPCWVWSVTRVSTTDHFERETEERRFDDDGLRAFLTATNLDYRWLMGGLVAAP